MSFEEFFKKKKINLTTLQQAEGTLFAEFKEHFELMGEKSFDHTKKYWFNKLRRQFPVPVEVKTEKVVIENPLAEQTITETLTEPVIEEKPKVGFTPRFKAGATAVKPTEPVEKPTPEISEENTNTDKSATIAKPGFTPRFKAGVTAKTQEPATEPKAEDAKPAEEPPKTTPPAKVGFTPRFKAGVTKPVTEIPVEEPKVEEEKPVEPAPPAKVGFTPRFKAGVTKPATEAPAEQPKVEEEKVEQSAPSTKVGFTPRFKAGVTKAVPTVDTPIKQPKAEDIDVPSKETQQTEGVAIIPPIEEKAEEKPEATTPPKIGFKPRFKPPQQ
ncbi:hypothetical protein [Mucilaginibacter jinjuensis]|uniref:Uncharacterized protein n=1 Tax=Mucilaginibacter jinjuensis TaxID=1176721 RepID=A0ABY7T5P5_9SPHI|nr:hypothetical protein [Mucilaginibacter jinjuensis]WCT11686.1 hypothetical protein PQO05_23430 [Mucilaginibacter jinjuensis]